jgi:hypothetical protein
MFDFSSWLGACLREVIWYINIHLKLIVYSNYIRCQTEGHLRVINTFSFVTEKIEK